MLNSTCNETTPLTQADVLKSTVYNIALTVFNAVTPEQQKSKVDKATMEGRLQNLTLSIDNSEAIAYLAAANEYYAHQIVSIVQVCLKQVMEDGQITLNDVPALMRMMKNIVVALSTTHVEKSKEAHIKVKTLLPLLEFIVCTVGAMVLGDVQYQLLKGVVTTSFQLVGVTLKPLEQTRCPFSCFGHVEKTEPDEARYLFD